MGINLKKAQFCALSRQPDFKSWLKDIAPDLYDQLLLTQKKSSCKANSEHMLIIYTKLYERNVGNDLETFLRRRFPMVIDEAPRQHVISTPAQEQRQTNIQNLSINSESLNKHKVFKSYKPTLLTFPQKKIIYNANPQQLLAITNEFLQNKISVDYIILEDRAYIEYFEQKFAAIADRIKKESREIYQYRVRIQQK